MIFTEIKKENISRPIKYASYGHPVGKKKVKRGYKIYKYF